MKKNGHCVLCHGFSFPLFRSLLPLILEFTTTTNNFIIDIVDLDANLEWTNLVVYDRRWLDCLDYSSRTHTISLYNNGKIGPICFYDDKQNNGMNYSFVRIRGVLKCVGIELMNLESLLKRWINFNALWATMEENFNGEVVNNVWKWEYYSSGCVTFWW